MTINFIIEFESEINKHIVPDKIRFTSSKNNQTASLTLIFYDVRFLFTDNLILGTKKLIKTIYFVYEEYKFSTKDIRIIWLKGRPLLIETIFLITSENEAIKLKKLFNILQRTTVFDKTPGLEG